MTSNLVVQTQATTVPTVPAVSQSVTALYTAGSTVTQNLILNPAQTYQAPVGYTTLVLNTSGVLQLKGAKGSNPTYVNQTVNQTVTLDDPVDSFNLTSLSTTPIVVTMTYTVNSSSAGGAVSSVNGQTGAVVVNAGPGLTVDSTIAPITISLQKATSTALGGIIAGPGTTIDSQGNLSVTGFVEGQITPVLSGSTVAGDFGYAQQVGYMKTMGTLVSFGGTISLGSMTTPPQGDAVVFLQGIAQMPAQPAAVTVVVRAGLDITQGIVGFLAAGSNIMFLDYADGSGAVPATAITATTMLAFTGQYSTV